MGMTLDMSNLRPSITGIGAYIHVFQDVDRRARHGPRIKVFPGSPGGGDATVVMVPTSDRQRAFVKGKTTVGSATLWRAISFVEENWEVLSRFWSDLDMGVDELLALLKKVRMPMTPKQFLAGLRKKAREAGIEIVSEERNGPCCYFSLRLKDDERAARNILRSRGGRR